MMIFMILLLPIFRLNTKEMREELQKSMARREQQLYEIEQTLPKANGTYLQIILGSVNVSILNKSDKYVILLRIEPNLYCIQSSFLILVHFQIQVQR